MSRRVAPEKFAENSTAYQRQTQFGDDQRGRFRQRLRQPIAAVTSLNDFASGER